MFRFLVFIGVVLLLSLIALIVWWVASKISRSIERKDSILDIEKEAHKKIKEKIDKEDF